MFAPFASPGMDLGVGVESSSRDLFLGFFSESMMLGRDDAFSFEKDTDGGTSFLDKSATLFVMKYVFSPETQENDNFSKNTKNQLHGNTI